MKKTILLASILTTFALPAISQAEEATSDWSLSSNVGFTSDYYVRGISQNWHKPALQGGFDIEHTSGFSAGIWGSNVSPNTFPDASLEVDLYAGYGNEFGDTGIGYSVGLIGYIYPGGDWDKCLACTAADGVSPNKGGRWDTYEANFGLSYGYVSGQVSVTLGDWFGVNSGTGFDGGSSGTTYVELNAEYPLPWGEGWSVIGHVGRLDVSAKLTDVVANVGNGEKSPDYTDYKLAIAKSFTVANSEGWAAELAYVGASDSGYWGPRGFGGPSFNGSTEAKDLADNRWTVSVSRSF